MFLIIRVIITGTVYYKTHWTANNKTNVLQEEYPSANGVTFQTLDQ